MRHLYVWEKIPEGSRPFLPALQAGSSRLGKKLAGLDLNSLGISEYNQRYLRERIASLEATLQLYGYLLLLSLTDSRNALSDFVLVDYGGGIGILSLLAKEMGIGRVVYTDIYDVSCNEVKKLAGRLDLELDDIVQGDMNELLAYIKAKAVTINAIVSFDVIEHVYDIGRFLQDMARLSDRPFRLVHASSANAKNPIYVRRTMREQIQIENQDRNKEWGWKERDALKSYRGIRGEIIKNYAPDLPGETMEKLAKLTRGLRSDDIERSINEYRKEGDITYRPGHPTNTCDPYTGNWAEHLMNVGELKNILANAGFSVRVLSGYRGTSANRLKGVVGNFLNLLIRIFGEGALVIAPYYVLYADYRAEEAVLPRRA